MKTPHQAALLAGLACSAAVVSLTLAGPAAAAPLAFDPNNDGTSTVQEVLTAPLLPAAYAPAGVDANGDGALSIGEGITTVPGLGAYDCSGPRYSWCTRAVPLPRWTPPPRTNNGNGNGNGNEGIKVPK